MIENSLKHNTKKSLTITISSKDGKTVDYKDNGSGIPKDCQEHIFDAFFKAHSDEKVGGHGLGLALCKRHMQKMKGDIVYVDSPSGAHLKLTFP